MSSNAAAYGGDPLAQHLAVIEAAREAGARRVVYTSHMGANASSAFPPMLDHAATELMLRDSGLAWTSLRNGFYASSGMAIMGDFAASGTIDAPADGKVSWTAHDDLAGAAARVLLDESRFEGPTPALTASQALDLDDLAGITKHLLGRPITRDIVQDEVFRAGLAARGLPEAAQRLMLGLFIGSRHGEFAAVDPALEALLGRPPVTMEAVLAQALAG